MWKVLCVLSVCVLAGGAAEDSDEVKLGDECVYSEDCSSISDSICDVDDVCNCRDDYIAASNKTTCLLLATALGDACEETAQCSNLPSAKCVDKTCVIAQAVLQDMSTTTTKPKGGCTLDSDCPSFPIKKVCREGACVLDLPPVVPVVPKMLGLDFVLNQACANDSECLPEGAACIDKMCKCKESFVPSVNLRSCLQKAKSLGDKCVENVQCLSLNGSFCENGKCSEKVSKFLNSLSEAASKLIGSSCQTADDCKHLSHSECRESVCQCQVKFVPSTTSLSCLEKAKKEGDACQIDKQCEDIKEATCVQEKCVKPGVVGTKLGKMNNNSGSTALTVSKAILAAIFLLKSVSL